MGAVSQSQILKKIMGKSIYLGHGSPPSRAVLMLIKEAGIDIDINYLRIPKKEQLQDFFVKLNPRHCIPTLGDDGLTICESRSIMRYLVDSCVPDSSLYPQNLKKRAIIDMWLDYDCGRLAPMTFHFGFPLLWKGEAPNAVIQRKLNEELAYINNAIEANGGKYLTGNDLTIADFSLFVTLSMLSCCELVKADLGFTKYESINKWVQTIFDSAHLAEVNAEFKDWKSKIGSQEFRDTWSTAMSYLYE